MSARALLLCSLLAAGSYAVSAPRATERDTALGARSAGRARSAEREPEGAPASAPRRAPTEEGACRRAWPHDPRDPRVGVWVFDHDVRPGLSSTIWRREIVFFDGSTVTAPFDPYHFDERTSSDPCWFSPRAQLREYPSTDGYRLHAQVDEGGWLWALDPCGGWGVEGRFVGDHFETEATVLRKLPVGAMDELRAPPRDPRDVEFLFRCHAIYDSRTHAVPELPRASERGWIEARRRALWQIRYAAETCRRARRRGYRGSAWPPCETLIEGSPEPARRPRE